MGTLYLVEPYVACRLSPAEASPTNEVELTKRRNFNEAITKRYGDSFKLPSEPLVGNPQDPDDLEPYEDNEETSPSVP